MSPADYLTTLAEPTRLRVLNCLAATTLYVSDLVGILELPQPTVSRHLRVLRTMGLVQDRRFATRVAYHLTLPAGAQGRMVQGVLHALKTDPAFRADAAAARARGAAPRHPQHPAHAS
jgi:ArsR family transcriptional regulator, arsenate/arsenite/antimonite-responsive transcriptional repressor